MLPDKNMASIQLAMQQTQALGNNRFFDAIEQATGQRREPKPRARPRQLAQQIGLEVHPEQMGLSG